MDIEMAKVVKSRMEVYSQLERVLNTILFIKKEPQSNGIIFSSKDFCTTIPNEFKNRLYDIVLKEVKNMMSEIEEQIKEL